MLRKAGKTAEPIGLIFFVDTQGYGRGVLQAWKFQNIFINFFPTGNAGTFR